MYYYLIQSLKRRLILELRDSFAAHPVYSKIVPHIQNRFSFKERPQFGIVVKGSSANKVQLDAGNFMGTVESYVMLAYIGQWTYPLEWVREDLACIQANGGVMPTAPGVYYIEIMGAPAHAGENGYFVVDPLLTVTDEPVLLFRSGIEREAQLQQTPVEGTLRLWEDHRFLLEAGRDYNLRDRGAIELIKRFTPNSRLTADYRYALDSVGPVAFQWNSADFNTLPGVVLAFGKRAKVGDKVAIVVYLDRVDTAQAFGGKFEASFDLEVITRDTTQTEEVTDLAVMYLWGQKKAALEFEGIEITDVSIGGEAEEVYDETGNLNFYTASLSISLRADWEVHVPLPLTISRATPTTAAGESDSTAPSGIQQVSGDLFYATRPVVVGRNDDFERIT